MKGYFYTLIITSVVGSVCAMLANGGFEKYIKYIAALICALMILSPLKNPDVDIESIINEDILPESETYENGLLSMSAEMTEQKTEEYISETVFSEFGIKPLYSIINIDWDADEPTVQSIKTALSSEDIRHSEDVGKYLRELLGGEVEIIEG